MRRFSLATVAAGLALAATVAAGPAPAGSDERVAEPQPEQAVENRAAVVVDTGSGVRYGCVRFTSDTISGREALLRAAMDPVFQEFGGSLGSAVCALCGTGCPVGSCLTCASQVWSYWRAPPGGGYSLSSVGVSSTVVHDGDVEGWVWGRSGPPPGITVENVCGPKEEPPAPPPPAPVPGDPSAEPTADGVVVPGDGAGAAGEADTVAGDGETPAPGDEAAAAGEAGTGKAKKADEKRSDDERDADGELTAATSDDSGGGGGPPASLLGLLALLAVLAGAALWFRHVRTRAGPAPSP